MRLTTNTKDKQSFDLQKIFNKNIIAVHKIREVDA